MNTIFVVLTTSWFVVVFALLIMSVAWWLYINWYRENIRSVSKDLKYISEVLSNKAQPWSGVRDNVRSFVNEKTYLRSSWFETEQRILEVSEFEELQVTMFGMPRDIWNPSEILNRRFPFSLAESIPNILVGVGLFFTFIFLSWALLDTTAVLTQVGTTASQTEHAISDLLKVAGGKFLTSLAGLGSSIFWTIFSKKEVSRFEVACNEFLQILAERVSPNGGELVMLKQVKLVDYNNQLSEEFLAQAREQTGIFRRFETDLAVALAGAITESFSPQMQSLKNDLVSAIDNLSNNIGSMNQDALQSMLEDFSEMLKEGSQSEMARLREELGGLTDLLKNTGDDFGRSLGISSDYIKDAGSELVLRVQEISQSLAVGATALGVAANSVKSSMQEFEVTIKNATVLGSRGTLFVNESLERAGNTVDQLTSVSEGLTSTINALQLISGKIADVVDNVEELSREQRSVVNAVREIAPSALEAIGQVANILDETATKTKQSMESTTASLTSTVGAITGGISSYTGQVAKLHRDMDNNLARAISSINQGINDLEEAINNLSEEMNSKVGE